MHIALLRWLCTCVDFRWYLGRVIRLFARRMVCALPLFAAGFLVVGALSRGHTVGHVIALGIFGPVLAVLAFAIVRLVDAEFGSLLDGLVRVQGRRRYPERRQRVSASSSGAGGDR